MDQACLVLFICLIFDYMKPVLVIVNGFAATGKSSIAKQLAEELDFVFLSKDSIKESLFDSLGSKDRGWSKVLGAASFRIMYTQVAELLAKDVSIVIETVFNNAVDTKQVQDLIDQYNCRSVQILCSCDGPALYKRFVQRSQLPERHKGHCDYENRDEFEKELLNGRSTPLSLRCPLIEVETTDWGKVNIKAIIADISKVL